MLKWLRRFKAPPFSYTAHVYLKDTWRCQLCERLVHANALASHARIEHGMDTTRIKLTASGNATL